MRLSEIDARVRLGMVIYILIHPKNVNVCGICWALVIS